MPATMFCYAEIGTRVTKTGEFAHVGMFTGQFGIQWMINFDANPKNKERWKT